jgi:hypothetical protein
LCTHHHEIFSKWTKSEENVGFGAINAWFGKVNVWSLRSLDIIQLLLEFKEGVHISS